MSRDIRPHNVGGLGTVQSSTRTLLFTDDGVEIVFDDIPPGAVIERQQVNIITAFDGGTTNVIDTGWKGGAAADPNGFGAAIAAGSIALIRANVLNPRVLTDDVDPTPAKEQVVAQYDSTGTTPTAGEAEITIWFTPLGL